MAKMPNPFIPSLLIDDYHAPSIFCAGYNASLSKVALRWLYNPFRKIWKDYLSSRSVVYYDWHQQMAENKRSGRA